MRQEASANSNPQDTGHGMLQDMNRQIAVVASVVCSHVALSEESDSWNGFIPVFAKGIVGYQRNKNETDTGT